jgi:CheY-like chemotaxis protein
MAEAKILICESAAVVALDLQKSLHDLGYKAPVVVSTAKEATQAAFSVKADLILIDVNLETKYDGIEAVSQIRSRVDVPVIYMSADSDTSTLQRASCTRPHAYLLKPLRLSQLRASIELAIYSHKLHAMAGREATSGMDRPKTGKPPMLHEKSTQIESSTEGAAPVAGSEQMLPICSCCKQIRDEGGSWTQPEEYFRDRFNFLFTHTLCPECVRVLRPQYRS